ncbi:MAG TPA: phosphate ABC transporter substrate-binding protein [Candidatus Krumholzibacteria bacterium]
MIRSAFTKLTVAFVLIVAASVAVASTVAVDSKLASYQTASGVSGNIKSVGSDTMNNLMALWAEDFRKLYPNVQIEIEGKGSSTAPPALVEGTATFGPMSRSMKNEEVDQFEKKYGYKPTAVRTSIDMLAVYVSKDNPIEHLTLQQIDAIFSKTRKGGATAEIRTWGDLGLTGEWADKPISLYGRNSASGTYGYFKEHALFKGDYKDDVKEQPGSAAVVQAVATDRYAIGYSGIGYKTADVKAVPLKSTATDEAVPADPEHAYTGKYPLARFLYIYLNQKPGTPLDPLRREFLVYVFSKDGQSDVIKDGYFPVNAKIANAELAKIGVGAAQ